ncbi:hypothetical protein ABIE87_004298 [Bradyrhizobium diazoefficiens]|uniref:hypothetical protein n=1 Tax=Bradyrhizobium diazoefficiens TaxID=1355477 RepID=UPI00351921E2
MKFAATVCLLVSVGAAGAAAAADPFYIGSWTFTAAVVAPWADPQRKPDDTERARLMGKTVVLKANEISGPRPFACAKPQYKVTDYGPDMIFQGAFDEMRRADKKADPQGACRLARLRWRPDPDFGDRLRDRRSFRRRYNRRGGTQQLRVYAQEALDRLRQCPFTPETRRNAAQVDSDQGRVRD